MIRLLLLIIFLPLQLALLVLIGISECLKLACSPFRKKQPDPGTFSTDSCSLVMLNWNGIHLLQESIPALLEAVQADGADHQVIVVDNGSTDNSVEWLEERYPEIEILKLEKNRGFGKGNNLGVEVARHDIVVLLNNDMIVRKDFLRPLLDGFSNQDIFAVTSQVHFPAEKRREETGATSAYVSRGWLHFTHLPIKDHHLSRKHLPVLWAGGGSSAFRKSMFLELGGFSDIYSPCYQEDVDLSFRAWKMGWHSILAPESNVLHKHRGTSSRMFDEKRLKSMVEERKLWFAWINFQLHNLVPHLLLLPFGLTKWMPVSSYLKSLRKLPGIMASRIHMPARRFSDKEILNWSAHPLAYLNRFRSERFQDSSENEKLKILIVSCYLPHLGTHGGAGRVFQLMKRVAARHEVTLITYLESEADQHFLDQSRACCHKVVTVPRGRYRTRSWYPYEPFEEFNCDVFRESLEDLACATDYDLVHFEWTQMAEFSDLFPFTPKFITEVEVNWAAHRTLVKVESNPLKKAKKYYNTLQTLYREAELCKKADRIVCVTEDDKNYMRGYVPDDKLLVVKTGVDLDYFSYSEKDRDVNSIVFVGAFRHSPNLDAMHYFHREIFPEVIKACPETHLYIVGSAPPDDILALGNQENITVTGFVEDIRDYYWKAQVVIVPLRTGVGIRGKVLEGWAAGSAMVATPLACQGIKAVHNSNIMIADNPSEFAESTVRLLKDPEKCLTLARRGRIDVEELYGWDAMGKEMIDEYESFLKNRRNRRLEKNS